jgi:hypothetical protein
MLHQKKKLNMKIEKTTIDVCPLCNKRFSRECKVVKVKSGKKLLFYAHKRCVSILDAFISCISRS